MADEPSGCTFGFARKSDSMPPSRLETRPPRATIAALLPLKQSKKRGREKSEEEEKGDDKLIDCSNVSTVV